MPDDGTYLEFGLVADEVNPWSTGSPPRKTSQTRIDGSPIAPAASKLRSSSQLASLDVPTFDISPESPSKMLCFPPSTSHLSLSSSLDYGDLAEDGDLGLPQLSNMSFPSRLPELEVAPIQQYVEPDEFDMSELPAVFDGSAPERLSDPIDLAEKNRNEALQGPKITKKVPPLFATAPKNPVNSTRSVGAISQNHFSESIKETRSPHESTHSLNSSFMQPDEHKENLEQIRESERDFSKIPSGFDQISNGLEQVSNGSKQISNRSDHISTESVQISNGSDKILSVSDQVSNVSDHIPSVSDQVSNVSDHIPSVSGQIPNVSDQIPNSSNEISTESDQIANGSDQILSEKVSTVSENATDASLEHASDSELPPTYSETTPQRAQSEPVPSTVTSPVRIHFAETSPPTPTQEQHEHFMQHKKTNSMASHFEYHQDPVGHIEKLRVYDDNGLPVGNDEAEEESSWQAMPTVGSHEMYDDKNNLVMAIHKDADSDDENIGRNAAASGYSRVANNDDAGSINSLDDRTDYLFDHHKVTDDVDADFQMASTKSMLTDQQKIAYAGLCRLIVAGMATRYSRLGAKSQASIESLQIWGRDAMLNLYSHLGLDNDEQGMIESLAVHNLIPDDLTPVLRQIQKVERNGDIMPEDDHNSDAEIDDNEASEVRASDLHEELPNTMDKTIDVDVKWTVMCDLFLILLSGGSYDSRSRTLLTLVASKLDVSAKEVSQFERKVTDVLQIDDEADQDWTEKDIIERRRRKALRRKYAYVGLATVGGGLVIGLSAGLLAPIVGAGIAGALSTIGIAGTSSFLAGTGGAVIITTASTAIGASVGSRAMLKRAGHVKEFEFRPIYNNNRVNVIITVGGWMTGKDDDVRLPFSTIDPVMGDVMSVHWEPEMMRSLGQTINILATEALTFGVQQILAATVFTVLMGALQAPMWLAKLSYLVDNPWSVSLDRAWAAGLILADSLMKRKIGNRPATLIGYGLGSRMIYSCLSELGRRNAFGLVQDVYLFGTPVFYQKKDFARARAMVSGRFVNGYSRKDWILAFLFPAAKRYGNVIGLDSLPEQDTADFDVENLDVSDEVDGHMSYRAKMPKLMGLCGMSILSEEFDEIEDPDPDQLREKQRQLLGELNTAEKPKKTGFFSSWSFDFMQRAKSRAPSGSAADADAEGGAGSRPGSDGNGEDPPGGTVIFDVDALRDELQTLKPRIEFEQESVPLPEHSKEDMPLEFADYEPEPVKPSVAMDYDDPAPKPPPYTARAYDTQGRNVDSDSKASKVQLQFDDLE